MSYTFNKKKVLRILKEQGIESDQIDWDSYSSDQPIEEFLLNNYGIVLKGLKEHYEDTKAAQEMAKDHERQQLEQEKTALLDKINSETIKSVVHIPKLKILQNFIKSTVESEKIHFFLCSGSAGIGKSYSSVAALKNLNVDYSILKGKITPLQLYAFLYENRNKTLLFDDAIGILDSDISISLLMSALWSVTETRTISYKSTSKLFEDLGIPDTFEYTGKIILLTNNQNYHKKIMSALQDRAFYYELEFNYNEKIQFMKEIIKLDHARLSYAQRQEIMQEIENKTNPTTKGLSFRTLLKAYSLYYSCSEAWKDMIKIILPIDEPLNFVWNSIKQNMQVKEAVKLFEEAGFGSRRYYFKLKSRLKSEI